MQMMIRCILGADQLSAFVDGMTSLVNGMTVWETRDYSPETYHTVTYRGIAYEVGSLSVGVDIVSDESWVEDIIRRVGEANTKEEFSVHLVHVFPIEQSYHIRNGFMDL
jgi:nitrogen regulatory protein PII